MGERGQASRKVIGITGVTGTLGRALKTIFLERGYSVIGLVRSTSQTTRAEHGLGYREVVGDVTKPQSLVDFVRPVDVVIHLAAYVGHGSTSDYDAVNVAGTRNLCQAIVHHNPSCRLVHCSSIAVLRIPRLAPFFATAYARSKAAAGKVVALYQETKGLSATTVYPGLIYGPGDTKFLPTVIRRLKKGGVFLVSGGERHAPLIYVSDLCELFFRAATLNEAIGQHYIGTSGEQAGIHDFFAMIADKVGAEKPTRRLPKSVLAPIAYVMENSFRLFKVRSTPPLSQRVVDVLSINFARHTAEANAKLGWRPRVSTEEGLARYLEWAKEEMPDALR